MSQVFRACCKRIVEGREKPVWDDTGLKLIIGEYNGQTTYAIADGRTGSLYNCFPIESRRNQGSPDHAQSTPAGERQSPPHDDDSVPF